MILEKVDQPIFMEMLKIGAFVKKSEPKIV